ncbi:hypothetical protein FZEAL_4554 [Fusarium zealandicum]|uniref:G domain-containing protein n=1 Tax=Fusarium zealandicum TaxID=1053134 RepID=A0A8H4XLS3_9HYPO|nr:hypothetical protein FZEAL_4554 [Fusarium zealandicum]
MPGARPVTRFVVLVDGCEAPQNRRESHHTITSRRMARAENATLADLSAETEFVNSSSIQRLKQLVKEGVVSSDPPLTQIPRYYVAVSTTPRFSERFKSKVASSDDTADLIKIIVKDVCTILEHPEDELWLYGSGHGALVARAVAGVVHRMGVPAPSSATQFDDQYDSICALIKAQQEDDWKRGPRLLKKVDGFARQPPRIPFVGLFDTVILTTPKISLDLSFVPSIETLRHALAMNETRSSRAQELIQLPVGTDMSKRSLIQAWFLGSNDDMCGGTDNDGLSLYPLQWMVLESIHAGLGVLSTGKSVGGENALSLLFPQYTGNLPTLDGSEEIEWRLSFSNGINISMFDLQSTHAKRSRTGENIHSIKLESDRFGRSSSRKIFEPDSLKGWNGEGPYGTIVHPSAFCILDRYPMHLDLPSFKPLKTGISQFQDACLLDDNKELAPWLKGLQLQASGVKAFRILVCGKTGVGKSTLINKVFGVEMTEESKSYNQGVHDINVAFESPKHPGLLIHDSRGWQAGSDTELELIAKFLRHRAFQEDPAEALHVIWFCLDADVSRIEEADKRTFATIAQYSHQVPVFVVGTKKDKLTGYRKMQLLEEFMEKTNDYKEAKKLAEEKSNAMADAQFAELRTQLGQIEHYKADGYCCLSKDDEPGVKDLLSQTLGLIVDERVRLFCVAAQVVDVEQKINSAITECMRLGTHAIRTAAVPLPFSGMIGTPTVSRLIVEHVLQCFGFPKAAPAEVEKIMSDVVMGNLKAFMAVSLTQFLTVSVVTVGVAVATAGAGVVIGAAGCLWALPATARMLLKCSCDMILILERSFRYGGKYVSVKQIEDAARYYTKSTIKTFTDKDKLLQQQVHDEIDALVPLKKLSVGYKFNKLRIGVEQIIYSNRFGNSPEYSSMRSSSSFALASPPNKSAELLANPAISELPGHEVTSPAPQSDSPELDKPSKDPLAPTIELDSTLMTTDGRPVPTIVKSDFGTVKTIKNDSSLDDGGKLAELQIETPELEGNTLIGEPREELEGSMPGRTDTGNSSTSSRWRRLSSWKLGSKKK